MMANENFGPFMNKTKVFGLERAIVQVMFSAPRLSALLEQNAAGAIELLETGHGQPLDTRAPGAAGVDRSQMEAVGRSTGPRSTDGKATASLNAYK